MSEGPKSIWVEPFFASRFFTSEEIRSGGTKYIRSDIVEQMQMALNQYMQADRIENGIGGDGSKRPLQAAFIRGVAQYDAIVALNALEEE